MTSSLMQEMTDLNCSPKLYYKDDWVRIFCGSCQSIGELSLESFDLVLTDPVYDNMRHYEFLGSIQNLLKPNAPLLVWSGVRFLDQVFDVMRQNYVYRGLFAFINQTTGHMIGKMINKTHFLVWFDKNRQSQMFDYLPNGYLSLGWGMEQKYHRWVKNPRFISKAITAFSKPNDVILDPFMGSGTVAYCAKQLNRKFIGFELELKFCEMAANKCRQEVFTLNI